MTSRFMSFILVLFLAVASALGNVFKFDTSGLPQVVKPTDETHITEDNGWELTFEDNFDGDSLDFTKWQYGVDDSVRRGGYWVNDAVFVNDGNLTIRTDYRENGKFGPGWYSGTVETSSTPFVGSDGIKNSSYKGYASQYGYYEVRCKVPEAVGLWAAFWLMPDNNFEGDIPGGGDDGAEIDIFESPFMVRKGV